MDLEALVEERQGTSGVSVADEAVTRRDYVV
jgi:hypothetical protein